MAYPGIFFRGGFNKFSWGQRTERTGIWGRSPLVRGSGGSCNLVQEISFHIVKFSKFLVLLRLFMMTTNLFVIADVKQLQTQVVLEFYCLFFRTSWGVGVLNSGIFNSFHNRVEFGTILEGLRNFGGGGWTPQPPPSVRHCSLSRAGSRETFP